MYFLSLQLIDNQEYVFVKLTFSSGLSNMLFKKMLDMLTAENQQLRSNGDLHFGEYIEDNTGMSNSLIE